jgi:hypothetical protein
MLMPREGYSQEPLALQTKTPAKRPNTDLIYAAIESGAVYSLRPRLGAALKQKLLSKGKPVQMKSLVSEPAIRASLAQYEFIRVCTEEKILEISDKPKGREFMKKFMDNSDWLESFLWSGPATVGWEQALENLHLLYTHTDGMEHAVFNRLATAMSLQVGKMRPYGLVDRYKHIQEAYTGGLLHGGFNRMDVREMRWTLYLGGNREEYQFLLDDMQRTLPEYLGACWSCSYRGHNVYGDTVQGPLYYKPWSHVYGWKEASRKVGGVCGSLSHYGADAAKSHGVMSSAVSQPGHCAYVIRLGARWPIGYNIAGPTGFGVPGWGGTGYPTASRLYEEVEFDRANFETATRIAWAARVLIDSEKVATRLLPGIKYSVYTEGVGAALPDFSTLTPSDTGTTDSIDLKLLQPVPPSNFGIVWEGKMEVLSTGTLKMAIHSDDQSRLWFNGEEVAMANCSKTETDIMVEAGTYDLKVEFCQGIGGLFLNFETNSTYKYGDWKEVYDQALDAQPQNFGIWRDYIQALETAVDTPNTEWTGLASKASTAFVDYHEAAWAVIRQTLNHASKEVDPRTRMAFLLGRHRDLTQKKTDNFEAYQFAGTLHWNVTHIGDPALEVEFFEELLRIHSAKPPNDWLFAMVMSWGKTRFANNPKTVSQFAKALETYFMGEGTDLKVPLATAQITAGIKSASDKGDIATFELWNDIANNVLPELTARDLHLNDAQAAAFPEIAPFPGDLLSQDGILTVNSPCGFDKPLSYKRILTGEKFGGYLDTNAGEEPFFVVQLKGESELSGIVLVNRYEYVPEKEWAVPLQISVSPDGKIWTETATIEKTEIELHGALEAKPVPLVLGQWQSTGPIKVASYTAGHNAVLAPEKVEGSRPATTVEWRPRPDIVDGRVHVFNEANSAFYYHRVITAGSSTPTTLSFGSDDALKVWLDGMLIVNNLIARGAAADQEIVSVTLTKGEHHLLVKVANGPATGGLYFAVKGRSARLQVLEGMPKPIAAIAKLPVEKRSSEQTKTLRQWAHQSDPQLQRLDMFSIDLALKKPKTKFVKFQRLPGKKDRLHFRAVLIYGRKLY